MTSLVRNAIGIAAIAASAALLAACGSGHAKTNAVNPPAGSSTTSPTTAPSVTTTTANPGTVSQPNPATTPTTAAINPSTTPPGCLASQLKVVIGSSGAAAGSIGYTNSFFNSSATSCTLYGYPGMQMLDSSGHQISTDVIRGPSVSTPSEPEDLVTLTPGQRAYFDMGFSDGTGYGTAKCPASSKVEFTAPNDYQSITVNLSIQPYGGGTIAQLHCGEIHVSPVYG